MQDRRLIEALNGFKEGKHYQVQEVFDVLNTVMHEEILTLETLVQALPCAMIQGNYLALQWLHTKGKHLLQDTQIFCVEDHLKFRLLDYAVCFQDTAKSIEPDIFAYAPHQCIASLAAHRKILEYVKTHFPFSIYRSTLVAALMGDNQKFINELDKSAAMHVIRVGIFNRTEPFLPASTKADRVTKSFSS